MVNLAGFHLLVAPLSFALIGNMTSLLVPLSLSGAVIAYIFIRGKMVEKGSDWYVTVHHKLAFRRATYLLIAYGVSAAIIGGGWLMGMASKQTAMQDILLTIATRIGLMPTFVMIVVNFVLETSATYQAGWGEIPDSFLKKYPAPPDIPIKETTS